MKNIITIVFRLTLSCLVAGFIMGTPFFIMTSKAKKQNEHVNEEKVMYSLLGYSKTNPTQSPSSCMRSTGMWFQRRKINHRLSIPPGNGNETKPYFPL